MKKYLLYIDILGFKNLVSKWPTKVQLLYRIINSLNVHQHHAFKTIVFSDTILVYNTEDATTPHDHTYLVMYACEFVQDLQRRLTGKEIYFRALLVYDEFTHYNLSNIECFYGSALISAYLKEHEIPAVGLFIDNASNSNNEIFRSVRLDPDFSFVFLNQSLERLQQNTDGDLPAVPSLLSETGDYIDLIWELRYIKSIYKGASAIRSPTIRSKFINTWHLLHQRYPKILETLVQQQFSLNTICPNYDWSTDVANYQDGLRYYNKI